MWKPTPRPIWRHLARPHHCFEEARKRPSTERRHYSIRIQYVRIRIRHLPARILQVPSLQFAWAPAYFPYLRRRGAPFVRARARGRPILTPSPYPPTMGSVVDFSLERATCRLAILNLGRPSGPIPKGGGCVARANTLQVWRDGERPTARPARVSLAPGGSDLVAFRLHVF